MLRRIVWFALGAMVALLLSGCFLLEPAQDGDPSILQNTLESAAEGLATGGPSMALIAGVGTLIAGAAAYAARRYLKK
ncbi:MAG: hypothetical protein L0099_07330 [Acidobacteria bacterium]|nr:hypothetical protein [Acidobacteriota bacterium]